MPKPTRKSLTERLRAVGVVNDHRLARYTAHWVGPDTFTGITTGKRHTIGLALYRTDPDYVPGWGRQIDPRIVLRVRWQGRGAAERAATRELFFRQVAVHLGREIAWERSPFSRDTYYPEGLVLRVLEKLEADDADLPRVLE